MILVENCIACNCSYFLLKKYDHYYFCYRTSTFIDILLTSYSFLPSLSPVHHLSHQSSPFFYTSVYTFVYICSQGRTKCLFVVSRPYYFTYSSYKCSYQSIKTPMPMHGRLQRWWSGRQSSVLQASPSSQPNLALSLADLAYRLLFILDYVQYWQCLQFVPVANQHHSQAS